MTDKALVKGLREEADEWDEPKSEDEVDMRGMLHRAADRIAELEYALLDVLVYAPDYMHSLPKKHYIKIARGDTK